MSKWSFRKIVNTVMFSSIIMAIIITFISYYISRQLIVIYIGAFMAMLFIISEVILLNAFRDKLLEFTESINRSLDDMIGGREAVFVLEEESLLSKVQFKMEKLYGILYEGRRKLDAEKSELEELITDISHQVKIPMSNIKLINETLLNKKLSEEQIQSFLTSSNIQIEKLDFLIDSMIKISRLETGTIKLVKTNANLYETIVSALNGVLYSIEEKGIDFELDCPDDLYIPMDIKWTGEAFFNLLDNAVKYSDTGSSISVLVENWEQYVKIDFVDNGKGISESEYAKVFQRFYREESVHDIEGVGIGLYLVREIISKQGGYIKLSSEIGRGSTFSVFLPNGEISI